MTDKSSIGTPPYGATNLTLEVQYNLEGLGKACNNDSCSVEVNTEADSSCDSLIDRVDESVGNRVLLTDLSQEGMGMVYVDIGTPIAQLFDRPMSVRGSDGEQSLIAQSSLNTRTKLPAMPLALATPLRVPWAPLLVW